MSDESNEETRPLVEQAQAIWHRRKWLVLLVFVAVFSSVAAVVRSVPSIYESTATVLVEHEQMAQMSGGLPDSVGANDLEPRLRSIGERIMSRSLLSALIARFDLYPDLRRRMTPDALVERMRRDIQIRFNEAGTTSDTRTTISFNLSYRGRDPQKVAQVTNALAALFLAENVRIRAQRTSGTTEFLRAQLENAKRQMDNQNARILAFKQAHAGELPEQEAANLSALAKLNSQLLMIRDREGRLTADILAPQGRLTKLREELADLRTRYTEDYPGVVRVKQEITDLEHQHPTDGASPSSARQSTDPRSRTIEALRAEEQPVDRAITVYERRVDNTPLVAQELQDLSQGYTNAKALYQSVLQRYEDAQLTEGMHRQQGAQFRILDPAVVSQQPVAPPRLRFLLIGLAGALGAAVAAAFAAEATDTSFHTIDDVRDFASIPVLAGIPPIVTGADARRRRRRRGLVVLLAGLGIAAVVGVSFYLANSGGSLSHFVIFRNP